MGGLAAARRSGHLFTSAFSWGLLASCGAEEWRLGLVLARVRGLVRSSNLVVDLMFCVETQQVSNEVQ